MTTNNSVLILQIQKEIANLKDSVLENKPSKRPKIWKSQGVPKTQWEPSVLVKTRSHLPDIHKKEPNVSYQNDAQKFTFLQTPSNDQAEAKPVKTTSLTSSNCSQSVCKEIPSYCSSSTNVLPSARLGFPETVSPLSPNMTKLTGEVNGDTNDPENDFNIISNNVYNINYAGDT